MSDVNVTPEIEMESSEDSGEVSSTVENAHDEAETTVVYGKYHFDDIEKYIAEIDSISFLEAVNMIKSIDRNLQQLEFMKSTLDGLYNRNPDAPIEKDPETGLYVKQDNLGADIASKNLLEESDDMADDANDFYANYNYNVEKMTELKALLQKKVDDAEGQHSTKYINDEMVRMLEKRLRLLDENVMNYAWHKRRYENILAAFSDRTNLDYLTNRIGIMLRNKSFIRDLKKELKNYSNTHFRALRRIAKSDQIEVLEYYLGCTMFSKVSGAIVMVALNRIAKAELASGKDAWVKVLLLNIVDIHKKYFDIGEPNEYLTAITDHIRPLVLPIADIMPKTAFKECATKLGRGATAAIQYSADYSDILDDAEKTPEEMDSEDTSEE